MRKLLYCSLGDTNLFKWAEKNGNTWEERSMKCCEYGTPELEEAYAGFKKVLADMFRFEGLTDAVAHKIRIDSVTISYDDEWKNRDVQIKAKYLMPVVLDLAKITTPKIPEDIGKDYPGAINLKELLDALQDECCKYIDGTRAQQTLNFDESAKDAETPAEEK